MRMFFERTGQVSIFIKAVPGMGVLFNFTYNLRVYIVAVFRVAVAFSFCAKDDNAGQDTDKTSEKAAAMSISHISSDTFFQLCIPQII